MRFARGRDISNIACCAVLATANHFWPNSYEIYAPEALIFTLLVATLLGLLWLPFGLTRMEWAFYGLLAAAFSDMLTGGYGWLIDKVVRGLAWAPLSLLQFLTMLAWVSPFCLAAYALRERLAKCISGLLLIMLLTALAQYMATERPLIKTLVSQPRAEAGRADRPDILILILDEHVGIEGIPLIHEAAKRMKEELVARYVGYGFSVYGKAYSNYFGTLDSLTSILNRTLPEEPRRVEDRNPMANGILEELHRRGYGLNIYQSNFMDFCGPLQGRHEKCLEYQANSIGYLKEMSAPRWDKMRVIIGSFVWGYKSRLLRKAYRALMEKLGWLQWDSTPTLPLGIIEQLKEDIKASPGGTAFFAHLLLPHGPYAYDAACRIKGITHWENATDTEHGNTPQSWERRQRLYLEQVACSQSKASELIEAMRSSGRFDAASVVVLGDHGSRIFLEPVTGENYDPRGRSSLEAFSAFLAIKPGGAARGEYIRDAMPSALLIGDFFGLAGGSGSTARFDKVYVPTSINSWDFTVREPPDFSAVMP